MLPLWGEVVDAAKAKSLSNAIKVPLGLVGGIEWWLDGSNFIDPRRSDCCLAWAAKVELSAKELEKKGETPTTTTR